VTRAKFVLVINRSHIFVITLMRSLDVFFGRVLACGKDGNVHIWDRRASKLSYATLPVTSIAGPLNSMQLSNDEQV
jgi:hypothetical protein